MSLPGDIMTEYVMTLFRIKKLRRSVTAHRQEPAASKADIRPLPVLPSHPGITVAPDRTKTAAVSCQTHLPLPGWLIQTPEQKNSHAPGTVLSISAAATSWHHRQWNEYENSPDTDCATAQRLYGQRNLPADVRNSAH